MASRVPVTVTVNGQQHVGEVEPRQLLVYFIRESLGLTGTHVGCDTSNCGACTVHVNGEAVKSCTVLVAQVDGAEVTTIEGMGREGELHPLQEAFWEHHGHVEHARDDHVVHVAALARDHPRVFLAPQRLPDPLLAGRLLDGGHTPTSALAALMTALTMLW